MKNLIPAILLFMGMTLLLPSCQPTEGQKQDADAPMSLEDKKKLLRDQKQKLASLTTSIKELEDEIAELDPNAAPKERFVTVQPVNRQDFKTFVEVQGSVQTDEMVYASSETGGRILKLHTDEGKWIKKGALVAETSGEEINNAIAEVEKGLELATDVYNRQKNLWDQNIGSEIQYLQAKNNKEQLEKKLESVKFNLTKTKVYAPISGVVDMVMTEQGEMAGPGSPIISIMNTSVVKVTADVSENYLKSVKRGARVKVEFPSLEIAKMARISSLGRTINPANRTLPVEIRMSNPKGLLKPNLLAVMHLNDYTAKDAVVLPTELIQQDVSGKEFVFVQSENEDKKLVAKKIFILSGNAFDGLSVIEEGLEGGELLIVEGSRSVTDGELLKVLNEEVAEEKPASESGK